MTPKQQCDNALMALDAIAVQVGVPSPVVSFDFYMKDGTPWFFCPEHRDLGDFSVDINSLLAEVLDLAGFITRPPA
jgi:hypothetical protein